MDKWNLRIRPFEPRDIPAMTGIWNEVVAEGAAFPQEEALTPEAAAEFFAAQSLSAVAEDEAGEIVGLYILHPNNVGRCGHIANASYAAAAAHRGEHVGRQLVADSLARGRALGFRVLQFNAVVESNLRARHLYESLGFTALGRIPGGFRRKDGRYEAIIPYYHEL